MQEQPMVRRDQFSRLTPAATPEAVPPSPRSWSDAEWATIRRGHRPHDMDDKWLAFVEDDRLFLHRSWTGLGVYEAQFVRGEDGWSISSLLVCGDRSSYRRANDAYEALLVEALIDGMLPGRPDAVGVGPRTRSRPASSSTGSWACELAVRSALVRTCQVSAPARCGCRPRRVWRRAGVSKRYATRRPGPYGN
jgi:hypothetical protein